MDLCTPPCSLETTPEPCKAQYAPGQTPVSSPPYSSPASHQRSTIYIPPNLTQAMVEADPHLKLVQRDLLVLTSMVDNSALSYRPTWFFTPQLCHEFWTLHNPPDVVSELLPKRTQLDRQVMTRRMRRFDDAAPMYLKTAADWARYCVLYGVPWDFLCEDQVRLLRLGLLRDRRGQLCAPPSWPLYPEPQPFDLGQYVLHPDTLASLPRKFQRVKCAEAFGDKGECIVVGMDGALHIQKAACKKYTKTYRMGKRWSYLPWTEEQELSCRRLTLKLRHWNTAIEVQESDEMEL